MNFQVETDTTFVDLSKNQIKLLHDEIFGKIDNNTWVPTEYPTG